MGWLHVDRAGMGVNLDFSFKKEMLDKIDINEKVNSHYYRNSVLQ